MECRPTGRAAAPFVVAHRAGNDLAALRRAEAARTALVEADVRLYHGRLEVRHLKTVGPLPLFWDRWKLAPPWTPRLSLGELLEAARPETELMLDLKGIDLRLARELRGALGGRKLTVCSQNWRMLERVGDLDGVRVVHSIASRARLDALRARFGGTVLDGVSIRRDLLDAATVADLRERAALVMTWPVATLDEGRRLAAWGVDGLISSQFEELMPIASPASALARAA